MKRNNTIYPLPSHHQRKRLVPCVPPERGPGRKKKTTSKRLQLVCQWGQRGCCQLPRTTPSYPLLPHSPQMLKIGAQNEGFVCEEAILMEKLAACFLKWLCWHEDDDSPSDLLSMTSSSTFLTLETNGLTTKT